MEKIRAIEQILKRIYGEKKGDLAFKKILPLIESFPVNKGKRHSYFSQDDVVLITYGDSLIKKDQTPLETLHKFAARYLKGIFSTIHILPFYPFSSDDGFSVKDFFSVNTRMGSWKEIMAIRDDFCLMFDYVLNHISAQSKWFKDFLEAQKGFKDLAIEVDPAADLSMVVRPRSLPLITEVRKKYEKTAYVWTTFSADQIDLNFKSIDVLEKMVQVFLFYINCGATILRLDAIAYLWKEPGTSCIHLRQAHDMVKLFRKILDVVAPDVMILTETNVPHDENISYFGDGQDEAQMVYNFTLPPLLLYAFKKEDSTILSKWAKGLRLQSDKTTFFNFTASHDGIGVRPLEGILPKGEINQLVKIVKENGGRISYKKNSDGSESPYELNITYVDAFLNKKMEPDTYHIQRFLSSQAIQIVLPGVPAVYIHSLLGSRNWEAGVGQTKRARTINREKLQVEHLLPKLEDPETFCSRIFFPYLEMIKIRKKQPAFHPNADYEILEVDPRIFAIARYCNVQTIYALTNISSKHVSVSLSGLLSGYTVAPRIEDLITGKRCNTSSILLNPYQCVWLSTTDKKS